MKNTPNRTVLCTFPVVAPRNVAGDEILRLMEKMVDTGLDDLKDVANDPVLSKEQRAEAQVAMSFEILQGKVDTEPATFANVGWTANDVMSLTQHFKSEKAAAEWLQTNSKHIRERLTEHGWNVLDDLLRFEGIPLSSPDDLDDEEE